MHNFLGLKGFGRVPSHTLPGNVLWVITILLRLKLCTLLILFYLTFFKNFAENSSKEAEDRVSFLAIAWDRRVQVAKLVKSKLKEYAKWSLDSAAIGVVWLDDQVCIRI